MFKIVSKGAGESPDGKSLRNPCIGLTVTFHGLLTVRLWVTANAYHCKTIGLSIYIH